MTKDENYFLPNHRTGLFPHLRNEDAITRLAVGSSDEQAITCSWGFSARQ